MFAAMSALDTKTAMQEYNKGEADHLGHAVNFFTSFITLV
jgi:hypothetical protein